MKVSDVVGAVALPSVTRGLSIGAFTNTVVGATLHTLGDKEAAGRCYARAAACAIGAALGLTAQTIADSAIKANTDAKKA